MAEKTILITLVLMALVTFIPRLLPAWFLRDKSLPPFVIAWLRLRARGGISRHAAAFADR